MDLKECPSCGSLAGTHIERCKFCGAALPRAANATVVPPTIEAAAGDEGRPDAPPTTPGMPPTDDPTGDAEGSTRTIGRQVQDPVDDEPFARPRLAGAPLPAGPPAPAPGGLGRTLRRLALTAILLSGVVAAMYAFGVRDVSTAESEVLQGKGDWYAFTDPDGAFTIDLPSEPYRDEHETFEYGLERTIDGRVGRVQYRVKNWDMTVGVTAGVAGEDLLAQMPDILTSRTGGTHNAPIRTTVGGLPALQFDVDAGDTKWSATAILTGRRVYLISIGGPGVAVGAHDRMAASFQPIDPNR